MSLRDKVIQIAPPWLRRKWGARVLYSFGLLFDGVTDWQLQGLRARFPSLADESALAPLGRDRRIVRGYRETAAAYRDRLLRWLDDWRIAGNPVAILQQVQGYYGPAKPRVRTVSNRGTWFTLEPDGTVEIHRKRANFDWDGNVDLWARFWLIVYPNSVSPPLFGDEGEWDDELDTPEWGDDEACWGLDVPSEVVDATRDIVKTWKPANTRCEDIIFAFDSDTFDPESAPGAPMPDGTWGVWSDGFVPCGESREPTARYCLGTRA